jgi:hypothetical protein
MCRIKWAKHITNEFEKSNDVKQGDVLLHFLFGVSQIFMRTEQSQVWMF